MIIFGAGGLAREYAAVARSCGRKIDGFVDVASGKDVICRQDNAADVLPERFRNRLDEPDYECLVGIGTPQVLDRVASFVRTLRGVHLPNIVHRAASLVGYIQFGEANVIFPGAVLTTDIRIGSFNYISNGVSIGHDVVVGDCNIITPGTILSGHVRLGNRVLLGSGAVVLPGVSIGDDAVIGAGAVVTRDVDSGALVVGVPARTRA